MAVVWAVCLVGGMAGASTVGAPVAAWLVASGVAAWAVGVGFEEVCRRGFVEGLGCKL